MVASIKTTCHEHGGDVELDLSMVAIFDSEHTYGFHCPVCHCLVERPLTTEAHLLLAYGGVTIASTDLDPSDFDDTTAVAEAAGVMRHPAYRGLPPIEPRKRWRDYTIAEALQSAWRWLVTP